MRPFVNWRASRATGNRHQERVIWITFKDLSVLSLFSAAFNLISR
jgi:hypothetical protein